MMVAFKIARRFLSANKGQTALIITGIAVGVAVQVFVGVLITSLQGTLIDRTIGGSSQVTVVPAGDAASIADWQTITQTARKNPDIKSVSPAADSSAFLIRSNRTLPILLRGFNMDDANGIYGIYGKIYQGRRPAAPDEVLTGRELNKELNIATGDKIELFTSNGSTFNMTVVGLYDLKVASLNKLWVLTTLDTSQKVFGLGGNVTSVEMQVKDIFKADSVASDLSRSLARTPSFSAGCRASPSPAT